MTAVSVDRTITNSGGRLRGRKAIVTGAGSGIGRAVATAFAREGASVGLVGRREAPLQETLELMAPAEGLALVLPCDVSDEAQVQRSFEAAEAAFGGLDTVVGVAGVELANGRGDDRVDRLTLEGWRSTLDTNLTGMFLTLKYGARGLIRHGGGSITVTGSPTGIRGHARHQFAYSASKAGTHGMVRVAALDLAMEGIRVNAVIPGMIDTPINAETFAIPGARDAAEARIPMRRSGNPEEVAGIYVWLASGEASYTTGAFFVIDGGQISMC